MIPIGDFSLLRSSVLERYADYETITFGILIADYQQQEAREYIVNYMDVFHARSGKAFDFFLPGYSKYPTYWGDDQKVCNIIIDGDYYHFSKKLFNNFCEKIESTFNIEYTFNPMLILMSMQPGYLKTAEYIVIELDDNESHNVRRSGLLFNRIFKVVKTNPSLQHIRNEMIVTNLNGKLVDTIVETIGNSLLTQIREVGKETKRFRIRNVT